MHSNRLLIIPFFTSILLLIYHILMLMIAVSAVNNMLYVELFVLSNVFVVYFYIALVFIDMFIAVKLYKLRKRDTRINYRDLIVLVPAGLITINLPTVLLILYYYFKSKGSYLKQVK